MLPVSKSSRDEVYFDKATVIYFVCVVVYFELKNSGMGTVQKMYVYV